MDIVMFGLIKLRSPSTFQSTYAMWAKLDVL